MSDTPAHPKGGESNGGSISSPIPHCSIGAHENRKQEVVFMTFPEVVLFLTVNAVVRVTFVVSTMFRFSETSEGR
jgi:hypothetical protein